MTAPIVCNEFLRKPVEKIYNGETLHYTIPPHWTHFPSIKFVVGKLPITAYNFYCGGHLKQSFTKTLGTKEISLRIFNFTTSHDLGHQRHSECYFRQVEHQSGTVRDWLCTLESDGDWVLEVYFNNQGPYENLNVDLEYNFTPSNLEERDVFVDMQYYPNPFLCAAIEKRM